MTTGRINQIANVNVARPTLSSTPHAGKPSEKSSPAAPSCARKFPAQASKVFDINQPLVSWSITHTIYSVVVRRTRNSYGNSYDQRVRDLCGIYLANPRTFEWHGDV